MRVTRLQNEDLRHVPPISAAAYLEAQGWAKEHSFRDIESYWSSPDIRQDLVLPLKPEADDYALRIVSLADSLASIEGRTLQDVLRDISTASMDVVSFQVSGDKVSDGTIVLGGAVELFENAKNALSAAARATIEPRAQFLGNAPREVSRYLKRVRMGQTEHGSYVAKLLSPTNSSTTSPYEHEGQLFDSRGYEREDHFSRSVTSTLKRALQSTQEAVAESQRRFSYKPFVDAVYLGVSANLCESLAKIHESGGDTGVSVNLRWAFTRPEGNRGSDNFDFDSRSIESVKEAVSVLRENDPYENYLVVGRVVSLHREQLPDLGQVTIKADIDESSHRITVQLNRSDYSEAILAHDNNVPVRIRGRLRNKGTKWFLENPGSLDLLDGSYEFNVD